MDVFVSHQFGRSNAKPTKCVSRSSLQPPTCVSLNLLTCSHFVHMVATRFLLIFVSGDTSQCYCNQPPMHQPRKQITHTVCIYATHAYSTLSFVYRTFSIRLSTSLWRLARSPPYLNVQAICDTKHIATQPHADTHVLSHTQVVVWHKHLQLHTTAHTIVYTYIFI